MPVKTETLFVHAIELEHSTNGEFFTRDQKIRAAILRRKQKADPETRPIIVVDKVQFHPERMGYHAIVHVRE